MSERTALVVFWKNYDRKNVLRYAEIADELGYDSFWVPEAWGYEAFSLLTEIAVATKRIKIATGIVNVFSRSPALMAMHAATLDEISEGLAPVIVQKLAEMIRTLKNKGYTVVLVEQNFRFAAPLADRFYVMEHGRIVKQFAQHELNDNMAMLQEFLGV